MSSRQTRHFTDKAAANAYTRELKLSGFEELENIENEHGGRMVTYRGKAKNQVGFLVFIVLLISVIGLVIYLLAQIAGGGNMAVITVIYRPEGDPMRTPQFVGQAQIDMKQKDVRDAIGR